MGTLPFLAMAEPCIGMLGAGPSNTLVGDVDGDLEAHRAYVAMLRAWDLRGLREVARNHRAAAQHDTVMAPHFLVAPTDPAGSLYRDTDQPGGPRGDAGVDLYFPGAGTVLAPLVQLAAPPGTPAYCNLVNLRVRARCWDPAAAAFVAYEQVPRSSIYKTPLVMPNSPGTIDVGYVGEIRVPLANLHPDPYVVPQGTALTQLRAPGLRAAHVVVVSADHPAFAATARGGAGFGSSGATVAQS